MMHLTDKHEWIDALLSGKYEQGHYQLKRESSTGTAYYCCLGVLCEINDNLVQRSSYASTWYTKLGNDDMPDDTFLADIGLEPEDAHQLAKLNDNERYSFREIAQWIADNVEAG